MNIFKDKLKLNIVKLIVFAMLLQLAVPITTNFSFAEEDPAVVEEANDGAGVEEELPTEDVEQTTSSADEGTSDGKSGEVEPESEPGTEEIGEVELPAVDEEQTPPEEEEQPNALTNNEVGVTAEDGKNLGNIFTSVTLTVDGKEIDEDSIIPIGDGTIVRLDYEWSIEDSVDLEAGDYTSIKIPDVFAQFSVPTNGDLLWNGDVVGTFTVDEDNMLTATFNNKLIDKANRNGTAWMSLEFNLDEFNDNTQQIIDFNTEQVKIFKITAKPGGYNSVVEKSGDANTVMNATSITWTVDINKTMEVIKDAKIEDTLQEGLVLDKEGIKIYKLTIGMDGKVKEVSKKFDIEDRFPVELGDIDSAYRIVYTTNISDASKESFTNNVNLTSANDITGTDKDTVATPKGSLIDKHDGKPDKDLNPKVISWTVDVNKAESSVTNAKVTDNLPEGLKVNEGTIKIYELSFDSNGDPVEGSEVNPKPKISFIEGSYDFVIDLGDIDSAYRIEYDTEIIYGKYKAEETYENKATLTGENITDSTDTGEATIKRGSLISKSGQATINHETKKITWTIDVNQANNKIDNAVVTDTITGIGTDLGLDFDSIIIYDHINQVVYSKDKKDDYTVIQTETGFTANLGNITTAYKIVYDTTIKNYNQTKFENTVGISGVGVGEEISTDVNPGVNPTITNYYEKSKISSGTYNDIAYDGLNYADKTMSWNIKVRPIKAPITSLTITDTFPNDGLVFLPDTLLIMKGSIPNGTPLVLGTDYTVAPKDSSYGKGFVIIFNLDGGKQLYGADYNIYYKTSFDPNNPDIIENDTIVNKQKRYINQVVFTGTTLYNGETTNINETKTAYYDINETSTNNGKKVGRIKRDNREIDWEIYVNYLSKEFAEFKVTDTLSLGQEFEHTGVNFKNNFVVKKYSINQNGGIPNERTTIDPSNYEVIHTNDGFELTFNGGIKDPYVIEFTTKIVGVSNQKYSNKAGVTGGQEYNAEVTYNDHENFLEKGSNAKGTNVFTDDEISWTLTLNKSLSEIGAGAVLTDEISTGHVYLVDSLVIKDSEGNELEVGKDYTLSLEDVTGGEKLTITFNNPINQIYTVEYKTVVTGVTGTSITNKASFQGQEETVGDNDEKSYTIIQLSGGTGQGEDRGKIKITKVKEDNCQITQLETEFELYYVLNDSYRRVEDKVFLTTGGVLEFKNLPFRTYYLREVKAPTGYEIPDEWKWEDDKLTEPNEWPEELVIVVDKPAKTHVFELNVTNTKIKIEKTATKVWVNGPEKKPEIKLQLYRNSVAYGEPVTLENGEIKYTWIDLDKFDDNGDEYIYTVDEIDVPENYEKVVEGLTVTNTYVSPKTEVTGKKIWVGGPTPRQTIELQLYRDGKAYLDPVKLEDGKTEHTWTNLDETNEFGEKYNYTVDEVKEPQYYSRTIDGLTITNTYKSPVKDIIGRKTWVNGELKRPEFVELQLYRQIKGGVKEKVGKSVRLEKGTYEYNWKAQDITDVNGNEYIYLVEEVGVPENYTKVENGLTVTNTYVIPKTEVTGIKEWVGGPSKKPTIELQLYRDGVAFGEPVKLENGQTEYTWVNLDETDINGKEYVYTVDEVEVPSGYRKEVLEDRLTVRNTIIPDDPYDPEGRIRIIKKDSDTRELLSGAKFELIDSKGNVVETLTTNSRGEATSRRLPIGWYTIEETNAPKGYILEAEVIEQKITDGVTSEVVIFNEKEEDPEKPVEPIKPTDPEKPTEPGKPTEPDKPVGPGDEFENVDDKNPEGTGKPEENKPTLPKTGYTIEIGILMLGFVLLTIGLILKIKENN